MFICYSESTNDFAFGDSLNEAFENLVEISDCEISGNDVRFFREVEFETRWIFAEVDE